MSSFPVNKVLLDSSIVSLPPRFTGYIHVCTLTDELVVLF